MADHRDGPNLIYRAPAFVFQQDAFTPVSVPLELDLSAPTFNGELTFNGETWPAWAPPPVGDLLFVPRGDDLLLL